MNTVFTTILNKVLNESNAVITLNAFTNGDCIDECFSEYDQVILTLTNSVKALMREMTKCLEEHKFEAITVLLSDENCKWCSTTLSDDEVFGLFGGCTTRLTLKDDNFALHTIPKRWNGNPEFSWFSEKFCFMY